MNTGVKSEDREFVNKFIEAVNKNMEKCNVGEFYGALYESGYRAAVKDVLDYLSQFEIK